MKDKKPLILVANPGSASRKYALYHGEQVIADLHFEWVDGTIICTATNGTEQFEEPIGVNHLNAVLPHVQTMFTRIGAIQDDDVLDGIGLRIVAPSGFFLQNHRFDAHVHSKLHELEKVAPLHIGIVLEEYELLQKHFPGVHVYGISDSAFHITKPDYAWNYAIPLADSDKYEIKRYGYHGLSVQSALHHLRRNDRLANKIVIAHLGSGGSITALHGGKSLDNTMGYSPLEGLMMATRSGSIDYSAVRALQLHSGMNDEETEIYLNEQSGLLGIGDSPDIRELLSREDNGDERAHLALSTFAYSVQKGIAQMTAALGGIDALVFTGTVGERSATMRQRIVARLHYLDFILDPHANLACQNPMGLETLSKLTQSKPIYVVHADEAAEIARQTREML